MTDEDYDYRVGDYGIRSVEPISKWEDPYREVVRISTGEILGRDGGEPEDQTLTRDWQWVVAALRNAFEAGQEKSQEEISELKEEVRRLEWLMDCGCTHGCGSRWNEES